METEGKYAVVWDNGHACGRLALTFETEEAAEMYGADWKLEMVAMDEDRRAAEEAYSYEVINLEESDAR